MPAQPRHICGHMIAKPAADCLDKPATLDELQSQPCPRCTMLAVELPPNTRLVRGSVDAAGIFHQDRQSIELDSRVTVLAPEQGATRITLPKAFYPFSVAIRFPGQGMPTYEVVYQAHVPV